MIDKNSIVKSLYTIAEQVKSSDSFAYDRLMMLGSALEHGTNVYGWSSSDIYMVIDPESIVTRYKSYHALSSDWTIGVLETVRNALIFLPIMVTWYGIAQATDAYNTLISAAIKAKNLDLYSQPFLYLWQQRFGGILPGYLTLSSIALADVFILSLVLGLTFLAYTLSGISGTRKEQDALRLRSRLVHTISIASLSLRNQPPLTAGGNLELAAQRIDGMARDIASKFDTMASTTASRFDTMANATASRFDGMAQTMTNRFNKLLTDSTGEFTQATRKTQGQLDNIAQEMMKQLHEGGQYLVEMGNLTSGTVQISKEIQSVAKELKTSNQALINSIDNLVKPAQSISQHQADIVNIMQQSATSLQGTARSMGDLVTRQQKMSAELTDVLDSLTLATEQFALLAKDQEHVAEQQDRFLQHLQEERDKQTQLAVLMSDSTVKVKNALDEMNNGAISLRRMSVDMNDMLRMQAQMSGLPMGSVVGVSDVLASYEKAARMMEGSGNSLAASAIAIQRASQQLRDVLDDLARRSPQVGPRP